ncbi:hypothetical protein VKT23_014998 [Stygiomarasmius scandens]|uniref:Uncharacterized protein n=1 Tax=Marasmiellus scandens TaxID=2682957 RepID=A0ABR1IZ44_9AGAR
MLRSQWVSPLCLRVLRQPSSRCLGGQRFLSNNTRRILVTVNPKLIRPVDITDISGLVRLCFDYGNARLQDVAYDNRGGARFPPDAIGYYYYHTPSHLPLTAGAIRFAVCKDRTRKGMQEARDLIKPEGIPFEITLWQLCLKKDFWDELIEDGVITRNLLEYCAALLQGKRRAPHTVISGLRQPFPLNLAGTTALYFLQKDSLLNYVYYSPLRQNFDDAVVPAQFDYDDEKDVVFLEVLKAPPGEESLISAGHRIPLERPTSINVVTEALKALREWKKILPPAAGGKS